VIKGKSRRNETVGETEIGQERLTGRLISNEPRGGHR
jgi:hypothetical protein